MALETLFRNQINDFFSRFDASLAAKFDRDEAYEKFAQRVHRDEFESTSAHFQERLITVESALEAKSEMLRLYIERELKHCAQRRDVDLQIARKVEFIEFEKLRDRMRDLE